MTIFPFTSIVRTPPGIVRFCPTCLENCYINNENYEPNNAIFNVDISWEHAVIIYYRAPFKEKTGLGIL